MFGSAKSNELIPLYGPDEDFTKHTEVLAMLLPHTGWRNRSFSASLLALGHWAGRLLGCTGRTVKLLAERGEIRPCVPGGHLPHLIRTREAAKMLGKSPATLRRWRYEGVGPNYVSVEGSVMYDDAVLEEYIQKNTRVPSVRAAMEEAREAL